MPAKDPTNSHSETKPIWKNLGPRAISAVAFASICILPLWFGGYVWAIFVLILGLRLVLEWVRMSDAAGGLIAMAIPMVGLTIAIGYLAGGHTLLTFLTLAVTVIIAGLERVRRGGVLWSALGTLYILVPTILMVAIRGDIAGFSDGLKVLLFIILVVIGADVGAYFGGSAFKGPKIAPSISPNKTWSGFISGVIFGAIVGLITGHFMGLAKSFSLFLALPVIVFSVVGDFLESGIKRHFNVKDTGKLMPGHGGLLDRLDGLMLALIASAAVIYLVPSLWPSLL